MAYMRHQPNANRAKKRPVLRPVLRPVSPQTPHPPAFVRTFVVVRPNARGKSASNLPLHCCVHNTAQQYSTLALRNPTLYPLTSALVQWNTGDTAYTRRNNDTRV